MNTETTAPVQMVALEAVVTRADGTVENLGEIAYWHRSRARRWLWRLRHPSGRAVRVTR